MKKTDYTEEKANLVLAGIILNETVCSRISGKWKEEGLFSSRWQNIVAYWGIRHQKKYSEPLGEKAVETTFQNWAAKRPKAESTISSMEKFLYQFDEKLIEKVEGMSSEYLLDIAGEVFNKIRIRRLLSDAEDDLEEDNVNKASSRLTESIRVELGVGGLFLPGRDYGRWRDAFEASDEDVIIAYPGKLGEFVGNDFCRDAFVAFLGATGSGKSWVLLDAAFRGIRRKKRVAFFECGDLSQNQVLRRMAQRALRRPKYDTWVKWPTGWDDEDEPIIKEAKLKSVTPQEAYKAWQKVQMKADLFRLSCHPNTSISVEGINSILTDWSRENWIPDAVVIDYADILAPPSGISEFRDQINTSWKYLRRMSQEFHCLVLTATQGDAESYDRKLLTRRNFSDDRRKNDHVTGILGLNMTHEEKEAGVVRWNWLKRREEFFSETKTIKVAGCLAVGCPTIKFSF